MLESRHSEDVREMIGVFQQSGLGSSNTACVPEQESRRAYGTAVSLVERHLN